MDWQLILQARAKINLAIDVLFRRPDGYHEVAMILQTIALADRVAFARAGEISVESNVADLDCGPANLAFRAADLLQRKFAVRRGVRISLEKNIPMAAGLAGGSADAAAVLKGLNILWELGLGEAELAKLGATLGSDVPFCLTEGTMLATGRGEVLEALPDLPHAWVVLAKPPISVSTAWAYGNFRSEQVAVRPDIAGMTACLSRGDLPGVAARLGNVLETVTAAAHKEIGLLKKAMVENGALASLMSGSGPTVFGLTRTRDEAARIAEVLSGTADAWVAVTETVGFRGGRNGTTVTAD